MCACVCVRACLTLEKFFFFDVNLMYGSVVVALNINVQLYYDMMLIVSCKMANCYRKHVAYFKPRSSTDVDN